MDFLLKLPFFPLFLKKSIFQKKFQINVILWFFNIFLWDRNMKTTNVETFEISKNFENSAEISGENHPLKNRKKKFFRIFGRNFCRTQILWAKITSAPKRPYRGLPQRIKLIAPPLFGKVLLLKGGCY